MGKTERIYTDEVMKLAIESERKKLAEKIKKENGLSSVTIPFVGFTQVLGNKMLNNKALIQYKVRKTSLTTGVVEFI